MWVNKQRLLACVGCVPMLCGFTAISSAQQVVQRGALGAPASVLDETQQWTAAIPIAGSAEEDLYVPDVSTAAWLAHNYDDFEGKGVYTITTYTQYKRPSACRRDLVRWGNGDSAHLAACIDIGYRERLLRIDIGQKTVTLLFSSMVDQDGNRMPDQMPVQTATRVWSQMDPFVQQVLERTNKLVAEQMQIYNRKLNTVR